MNKKIAFILVIILTAGAGALLYFYKNNITTQGPVVNTQDAAQTQQAVLSVLDEKDFGSSNKVETYGMGSISFKLYPWVDGANTAGYFEVYQNGIKIFSSQPNYQVNGILAFVFGENKYVMVKDYSGGAHCCDTDYLFRINKSGEVKLIRTFEMGNATISKENLLAKNNKLYLVLTDDTFQYFHVPFAYSYFFPQYFQLNGDAVTLANNDFADVITKTAEDCKVKVAKAPVQPDEDGNYWLNSAVCYIANYALVGKQATALAEFDGFFNKFFPTGTGKDAFGETITRAGVKKEIDESTKTNDRFN